jgi:hypothetical protein
LGFLNGRGLNLQVALGELVEVGDVDRAVVVEAEAAEEAGLPWTRRRA